MDIKNYFEEGLNEGVKFKDNMVIIDGRRHLISDGSVSDPIQKGFYSYYLIYDAHWDPKGIGKYIVDAFIEMCENDRTEEETVLNTYGKPNDIKKLAKYYDIDLKKKGIF